MQHLQLAQGHHIQAVAALTIHYGHLTVSAWYCYKAKVVNTHYLLLASGTGGWSRRSNTTTQHRVRPPCCNPAAPPTNWNKTARGRRYHRQQDPVKLPSVPQPSMLSSRPRRKQQRKQKIYKIDNESRARFGFVSGKVKSAKILAEVRLPPISQRGRVSHLAQEMTVTGRRVHLPPLLPASIHRNHPVNCRGES